MIKKTKQVQVPHTKRNLLNYFFKTSNKCPLMRMHERNKEMVRNAAYYKDLYIERDKHTYI